MNWGSAVRRLSAVLAAAAAVACATDPGPVTPPEVVLVEVVRGLSQPLYVTAPPADPRLFVVEKTGRVRVVKGGMLLGTPFLDLSTQVSGQGEQGLLGLAFHPSYAQNGWFYVDYTNLAGDTRVVRYRVSADPDVADGASGDTILALDQPYPNHNGGQVLFGPDGMLYIPTGDGGSGGDPQNRAQDPDSLLGKLLRVDVDAGDPYAIPPDNPYAAGGGRGEVWAIGLRNPWRVAFDPPSGLLYVADVGQSAFEEVSVQSANAAGLNYGWPIVEGEECYRPSPCDRTGLVPPVVVYSHTDGCSVTGGYVYRGSAQPSLVGHYFYADYCSGWLRSFRYAGGAATDQRGRIATKIGNVTSFGLDAAGELYLTTFQGFVYRIEELPPDSL